MTDHIVKSFDVELQKLATMIVQMGGIAEAQLSSAIEAMVNRDQALATKVIDSDVTVDEIRTKADDLVVETLARRQPMATDLRFIVSVLRIASEFERIGDYAKNVAKRSIALSQSPVVKPTSSVPRMAVVVQSQIRQTIDAFEQGNAPLADSVRAQDQQVDELYTSLFRVLLTYMMEDPRSITACTHLLFIAKNIERIGDHATNIAELVHYTVLGKMPQGERPKGDNTAYSLSPGAGE